MGSADCPVPNRIHAGRNRRRRLLACVLMIQFGAVGSRAASGQECFAIPDPRFPGLQQCTVSAEPGTVEAEPETEQQASLWCWAASLSMIFEHQGHPTSQESIVLQNFGRLVDAPGGDFLTFEGRINRFYKDDDGNTFRAQATRILTPAQAARALRDGIPLLYSTSHHATVQTELTYQVAPGGPLVVKGGRIWDPAPGVGWRLLNIQDVQTFVAAWAIRTE